MKQSEVLARKRALMTRIQTVGAEAAFEAALAVCQDAKAPAPARATCATTILRAGGFFNSREDQAQKEPHQMTTAEIEARLSEMRFGVAQSADDEDDAVDVFG
ncbi:MAG: hypothetical protein INF52_01055 [Rhodobacter sp.]|nr:hypothetical protein [Rhodobacter sp.]